MRAGEDSRPLIGAGLWLSRLARRLQSGRLDAYMAYMLLAVLAVVINDGITEASNSEITGGSGAEWLARGGATGDLQQAVVLNDTLAACRRAGLDLATARPPHRQVGDERIGGFPPGPMRDHRAVPPRVSANLQCSRVSDTVPTWLTLISAALAIWSPTAAAIRSGSVTKLSSPTS